MTKNEWYDRSCYKTFEYKRKVLKLLKEFKASNNLTGKYVIHHIDDDEVAIEYNKNHYEYWVCNLDGSFEYGKYVVFLPISEHGKHHNTGEKNPFYGKTHSDETKNNIRNSRLNTTASNETKEKMRISHMGECNAFYGKHHTEEAKQKIRDNLPNMYGENNPMYGKRGSLAPCYGRCGELHPMYGKHHNDSAKESISIACRINSSAYRYMYNIYKLYGGVKNCNKFKHAIKVGDICFEEYHISVYKEGVFTC